MRYFILRRDPGIEWGIREHPALPDDASTLSGASITGPTDVFELEVDHPLDEPPRHMLAADVVVVSDRLAQALRAAGIDNFQSWPAALVNPEIGARWDGYQLFNVLGMVSAVAMGASRFDTIMGGDPAIPALVDFDAVVLDGRRCLDLRMFRVPESPGLLFIDEGVVDALRAQRPPEGWGVTVQEVEVR